MRFLLIPALAILLHAPLAPAEAAVGPADVVVAWNERLLAVAEAEDGFLTLKGVRAAAMMHLAMHDAVNAVERRFAPYALERSAPDADAVAAAVQAAFTVAVDQYPGEREVFDTLRRRVIPEAGENRQRAAIELGAAAAAAIVERRRGDGWDAAAEYRWHPMGPGVYAEFNEHSNTPEGFVFGAGWAQARPFTLAAPDQFRAPPPPPIDSEAYAGAYDEVKRLGRFQSRERTVDQTHLALWWKDFAENSHNRLARDLTRRERPALARSARLFALLNISIFDAYVNVFDNKFHYNHWRPYTAIRWAANDGNPDTVPEETWTNTHRHTYAFPSYPSAHGTACAAAMTAFEETFGPDYAFTMRIPRVDIAGPMSGKIEMHPPTRDFDSFAAAARECAMSRLYLGIHFRYDSTEGYELGRRIGEYVTGNHLEPR